MHENVPLIKVLLFLMITSQTSSRSVETTRLTTPQHRKNHQEISEIFFEKPVHSYPTAFYQVHARRRRLLLPSKCDIFTILNEFLLLLQVSRY